ncbi:MAG: hypothetical protein ABIH23_31005, partial [bacterium]
MNSRERINLALSHKDSDRVAIQDAPWFTTIRRWHREGLPENVEPEEYFSYEMAGSGADTGFQIPEETIEETDEYTVKRTGNGSLMRNWKNATSTPEMIGFTITSRKDWEEYRPRLAMSRDRIDWEKDLKKNHENYEA